MKRHSPIRHKVKQHLRKRKIIRSYIRGNGYRKQKSKGFILSSKEKKLRSLLFKKRVHYFPHIDSTLPKIKETKEWKEALESFGFGGGIDPEIYMILQRINKLGIRTIGSCQGHYSIPKKMWLGKPFVTMEVKNVEKLKRKLQPQIKTGTVNLKKDKMFVSKDKTISAYVLEWKVKDENERDKLFRETEELLK